MPKGLFTREGIYWARFKVRGKEYRFSLRTRNERIAERAMKAAREQIERQVWHGEQPPRTWQAAVVAWHEAIPRLEIGTSTAKRYAGSIKMLSEWLIDVDVTEIDAALLKQIVRDRSKRGATNATIRRDLTAISSVLGVAVDENWIDSNVAHGFDRRRVKEKRDPIVLPTPEAIAAVLALGSRFVDMADFARETGMREGEIVNLTHGEVDRTRMAATLSKTKTRRTRQVSLSARALAIIDRQPPYFRSPYVFWRGEGEAFKNVGSQFHATVKRVAQKAAQAGDPIARFRFHDLRHLFAVDYLRQQRGSIYELQQELGHESIKTTEVYLRHLTPDEATGARVGWHKKRHESEGSI